MQRVLGKRIYRVEVVKKRPYIALGAKIMKYCGIALETVLERSPLAIGRVLHEKVSDGAQSLKQKKVGVSLANGQRLAIKLPQK